MPRAKEKQSRLLSDAAALADKLAALSDAQDRFENGARVIATDGVPDAVAAVLSVIDDTVLERELTFRAGAQSITIVAAGRRLRGISAASTDAAAIIGKTISRDDPALVSAVHDAIRAHLDGAAEITVQSLPPSSPFGKGGERGISAGGLTGLWAEAAAASNLPPMARFLQSLRGSAGAFLHIEAGAVTDSDGDVAELQDIWEARIADFLAAYDKTRGVAIGEDRLMCFDGAMGPEGGLAVALLGDEVALLTYPEGGLPAVQAAWSTAIR